MKSKLIFLFAFLLNAYLGSSTPIGIYNISTHPYTDHYKLYGSIKGHTLLYIKGTGFDINPAKNQIRLGDGLCEIEYASENYLSCYTPAISSTEPEVAMTVEFVDENGEVISECWSILDCDFVYKQQATPTISSMHPRTVSSLSTLEIKGAYQLTSSSEYRSTKFYGRICQATNLNTLNYKATEQTINCIVAETTPVGLYNGSLLVSLGQAEVHGYGITVDDHQLFDVRIIPQIQAINGNYASTQGKTIEISGLGFGDHQEAISVELEGTPCQVTASSRSSITCNIPEMPSPSATTFHGAQGAKLKTFTLSEPLTPEQLRDNIDDAVLRTESALPEFETQIDDTPNYAALAYGYFRAARNGDHKFYISCQGECQLYIQQTPESMDRASMTLLAAAIDTSYNYYFSQETQISSPITLTAGNYYYIEAYHTKATAGAQLTVSIEIPSSTYRINSISEKVQIAIDSEIELEKYWISVYRQVGGVWKIVYLDYENLQVSDELPWNATCDDIVPQINKFGTPVNCSMGPIDYDGLPIPEEDTTTPVHGWTYNITFLKRREQEIRLTIDITKLIIDYDAYIRAEANWWNHASDPVTGTFTLSLGSAFSQVDCLATPEQLKQQFISDFGMPDTIEVLEDGGNVYDGQKWQIIFSGYEGDVPDLIPSTVNLVGGKTGTTPSLTITAQVNGSLNQLFEPIPADILTNAETRPQLTLTVNNNLASCNANCEQILDSSLTPIIDSSLQTSTGLTISLSNTQFFPSLSLSDFAVEFADSPCTPTAFSSDTITCAMPVNPDNSLQLSAGDHLPIIEITDFGLLDSQSLSPISVPLIISTVSPETGSPFGGQELIITGSGFGPGIAISLGSVPVTKIVSLTNTEITIITPHSDISQNSTFEFTLNSKTATYSSYSFITTGLPTIASLSKTSASPMIKSNVIAYGTGFGSAPSELRCILQNINDEAIYFELSVYSAQDTEVMCILGGGIQGDYELNIIKIGIGYSMVQTLGANAFKFAIVVTDFQPKEMGTYAGSKLVVTGEGFSSILAQNTITIGQPNIYCRVISATPTELICQLDQDVDESYLTAPQPFHVLQRISEFALCQVDGGCELTFIQPFLDCFEILNQ